MSIIPGYPDYELADSVLASVDGQLRALANPVRSTLLDLVLERAATVNELALATRRPKSTIAHHVGVLVSAGLLQVVRTRRVRAIEERFYGRTGRTIEISPNAQAAGSVRINQLADAAAEADAGEDLHCTLRRARIPAAVAQEFWSRVADLAEEFTRLPRSGAAVYGFAAGIYISKEPVLPDREGSDNGV